MTRGVFDVWRLPKAWRAFAAFSKLVPGHLFGKPDVKQLYMASDAICMGGESSVA